MTNTVPLILEKRHVTVKVNPTTNIYDAPADGATLMKQSPNVVTEHRVVCDGPGWVGIEAYVAGAHVLGFIHVSAVPPKGRTVVDDSAVLDSFVDSMVKRVVPIVKDEIAKNA